MQKIVGGGSAKVANDAPDVSHSFLFDSDKNKELIEKVRQLKPPMWIGRKYEPTAEGSNKYQFEVQPGVECGGCVEP